MGQGLAREHDCKMGLGKRYALQIIAFRDLILLKLLWGSYCVSGLYNAPGEEVSK